MSQEMVENGTVNGESDFTNNEGDDCTDSDKKRSFWKYLFKRRPVKICLFVLILVVVAGAASWITYSQCDKVISSNEIPIASGQEGMDREDRIPLRIEPTRGDCNGSKCLKRTHDIVRSTTIGEPYDCSNVTRRVKNSSCYLCAEQCFSFDDIKAKLGQRLCGRPISCCVIAKMGQLGGFCGDHGVYSCFSKEVHERFNSPHPICNCDAGYMGNKCNATNNDTVPCTCYETPYKYIDEEKMCNCSEGIHPSWSVCHTRQENYKYNCLCETKVNGSLSSLECP